MPNNNYLLCAFAWSPAFKEIAKSNFFQMILNRSTKTANELQGCYKFFCFPFSLKFIVVSLKEGMFNNANVLFKTKFVDGVSTVARFTQCQNGKVPKENESKSKRPKWSHMKLKVKIHSFTLTCFLNIHFIRTWDSCCLYKNVILLPNPFSFPYIITYNWA